MALALVAGCGTVENMSQTLDMRVDGEVLRLDGVINSRALRQFVSVLDENPGVAVVVLGRIDGSTDDEVVAEMGYTIRDIGLATRMDASSEVYSGGVDLFLAGVDRVVAPGAVVGVHEWQTGFGSARDYPRGARQHEPTRGYIEDMLGSDAFYWFTVEAAAFDEVHVMSRDELERYGVVTR
ncbi:alpha/beta hydrolase [Litoreibacter ponti]|uniref:alpha/beta hydrolase n=1 Tax=Litoreibacter ponti TaxID=1510457 RepID=UPI000D31A5DB|nr:alpha/beta hydrolase [Litoreibacter ponti]